MAIIKTKYDKGDTLYTIYGNNLEYGKKVDKIKVKDVGYNKNGIVYFYEGASGFYEKEGIPEHEIIGKIKKDVEIFIDKFFDEKINELNVKRNELLKKL